MNRRVDAGLTVGFGVVIVILVLGLGWLGAAWVEAGLWTLGVLVVAGAISLWHGRRAGVARPGAGGRGTHGGGAGSLGDRGSRGSAGMGGSAGNLGSDAAWRAWLDEMEDREK